MLSIAPQQYQELYLAFCPTAVGDMTIAATADAVCYLDFNPEHAHALSRLRQRFPKAHFTVVDSAQAQLFHQWISALQGFLAGHLPPPQIPVAAAGTPFQIDVWRCLSGIPAGQTRTYQEIASAIGAPRAYRAVGTACGNNHIALLIPCHRALRKDGALGGFRWGTAVKQHLLALEQCFAI